MPVEILIDENDTIDAIITSKTTSVEIIAKVLHENGSIRLDGVHVELLSGGPLDRSQVRLLGDELCRHFGVGRIVVQGAKRTTGRSAGSVPRAIVHEVRL